MPLQTHINMHTHKHIHKCSRPPSPLLLPQPFGMDTLGRYMLFICLSFRSFLSLPVFAAGTPGNPLQITNKGATNFHKHIALHTTQNSAFDPYHPCQHSPPVRQANPCSLHIKEQPISTSTLLFPAAPACHTELHTCMHTAT